MRDIKKLAFTSTFGIVALFIAVIVATVDAAQNGSTAAQPANITNTSAPMQALANIAVSLANTSAPTQAPATGGRNRNMPKTTDKRQQPTGNRRQKRSQAGCRADPTVALGGQPLHAPLRAGLPLFKLDTFPLFLGNAGYLYLISTAVLPCAQSMAEPHRFGSALNPSIVVVRPGPHLRRDRPTSAPGLGPRLRRDSAHGCAGTEVTGPDPAPLSELCHAAGGTWGEAKRDDA